MSYILGNISLYGFLFFFFFCISSEASGAFAFAFFIIPVSVAEMIALFFAVFFCFLSALCARFITSEGVCSLLNGIVPSSLVAVWGMVP